jgi:hypothetical protein
MCTVLLPPGGYPIAVNKYKYININVTIHRNVSFASAIIIRAPSKNTNNILSLLLFFYDTLMMIAELTETYMHGFGTYKVLYSALFRVFLLITIIFNLRTAAFKAYCAIWFKRSNFRHQASPRVTTRKHPAAEGGTVGEKCPVILPKFRLTR